MKNKEKSYHRLLRLTGKENHSVFLFGPRGTGKTSWLCEHIENSLYFDLLHATTFHSFLADPTRLEKLIPQNYGGWVIIDEIQRIPSLLNEVHRLIEKEGYRFILTGSSARKLRQKGVNLLAGRAFDFRMHPLTCTELAEDFSLEKALNYGLLPAVYQQNDPEHYLESYINTYLREEVQQEGLTRNIGQFSRFLEVASFSQGEPINMTAISREASIERRVVSNYFDIVEDLLIGLRLPVFTKKAKRETTVHPKFYFFDAGVYRTIRPKGPLDKPEEADGPGLETLFLQHLRAYNDYYRMGYQFYYWRTVNKIEVDFIAYGEKGLLAFEIKRTRHLSSKELRGLRAFGSDYPMAKLYILYGGNDKLYFDNIMAIPFEEALKGLKAILSTTD